MFFILPYGTDAPVYYWPFATVGLIVVNVAVFALTLAAPEQVEPFILAFGDGLHPVQWITNAFLHQGFAHIVGNMVFLWCFGLIVEGKLGWYKMLAVYLGIAAIEGFITQLAMLGGHGGALGASGAIFGLMAMSVIWAPENEIQCYFVVFYWVARVSEFEVKVLVLVGMFLSFQIVAAILSGMSMSSEMLHLVGASIGFPIAIVMLKLGWVDCEHWDLFSVCAGRHTMTDAERQEAEDRKPERIKQRADEEQQRHDSATQQIRELIHNGQPQFALKAHQRMSQAMPNWNLSEPDMLGLIRGLHEKGLWSDSISPMAEYLARYREKATPVRLKLSQILVMHEHRPAQAMKVLAKVDAATLDAPQREFYSKLRAKARQMHEQDPYEVAEHDW
jgi:membrane associated rhomboid family serine protease